MKDLIEKYRKDCYNLINLTNVSPKQLIGDETNPVHLLWMLDQIEYNTEQSETKKHRWLGYIQGVLVCKGSFTVLEERNYTRSILDGK